MNQIQIHSENEKAEGTPFILFWDFFEKKSTSSIVK